MNVREEIESSLLDCFVVQVKRYDEYDGDYWEDESLWQDHIEALKSLNYTDDPRDRIIVLRKYNLYDSGRISPDDTKIWDKAWLDGRYDPRLKDPDYRKYLELKKRFEEW